MTAVDDVSSVVSESASIDTIAGLPPTVEQRLQEAVDDFQLTWEISRVDENDNEVTPHQNMKLLRAVLAVCGKVAILVHPEAWKGVMDEVPSDYFPNLEELLVYRDEPVKRFDRRILV
ncbi:hypothetical protein SLS61_002613 [Didymella pomorum]